MRLGRGAALSGFSRVLVGYDGSSESRDALAFGLLLADRVGADLVLGCVFNHELPLVPGWEEFERDALGTAEQVLAEASDLRADDPAVETRAVPASSDAGGLLALAESEQADLIVVGSSHRGKVGRTFIGSVGARLLYGSHCPVAVVPRGFADHADGLRVVAAGFDGSEQSTVALRVAADLTQTAGCSLRVLAVARSQLFLGGYFAAAGGYDYRQLEQDLREQLDENLRAALGGLPESVRALGKVLTGDPVEVLVHECGKGVDVLIVGSRGYGQVRTVLLGSTSAKLVGSAPCPVIVIPGAGAQSHAAQPEQLAAK